MVLRIEKTWVQNTMFAFMDHTFGLKGRTKLKVWVLWNWVKHFLYDMTNKMYNPPSINVTPISVNPL